MRAATLLSILALALAGAPGALAQGHEHGGGAGIRVAHDLGDDGYTVVGALNHFSAIAFGDDAAPDFHQDLPVRVLLNGRTVFETTESSGHDYDGVNPFDIAFWEPGTFEVQALGPSGEVADSFSGTVAPLETYAAHASAEAGLPFLVGSGGASYDLEVDGSAVHSDAVFQLLEGNRVVLAVKTHGHAEGQSLSFAPVGAGPFSPWIEQYQAHPVPGEPTVLPFVGPLQGSAAALPLPALGPLPAGAPPADAPPAAMNAVVEGDGGRYRLLGTYDPWTQVGPDSLQTLDVLVVDGDGALVPHVDFTARLVDGLGRVLFESASLHEYDGVLEFTSRQPLPGLYVLEATASRDGWSASIRLPYTVLPPVQPLSAGPVAYGLRDDGAVQAGGPETLTFTATDGAGMPFGHSEILVEVLGSPLAAGAGPTPPYLVRAKLHTHGDGVTPFTIGFPEAGTYTLRVTPSPLEPRPILLADSYLFEVQAGPPAEGAPEDAAPEGTPREMPAPGLPALVAAAALALLAARRRTA